MELRWQSFMERSPFGIVIYRPDGSVQDANPAMKRIFCLTQAEHNLQLSGYNILQDPRLLDKGVSLLVRKAFSGEPVVFPCIEYEIVTPIEKAHVRRWLQGVLFPVIDDHGKLTEVVSIQVDVSERERARVELHQSKEMLNERLAELEQLYATAPVGLSLLDAELRYVRVNERFAAITGKPVEEHIGRSLAEVIPEVARVSEPVYRRVLETGEAVLDLEMTTSTPAWSGTALVNRSPVKNGSGNVVGVSTVVQDITERKRAQERQRDLDAKLQQMQKLESLGLLTGGVAHDFNNLLTVIVGNLELLRRDLPEDREQQELVNAALAAAHRGSGLTHNLLAFARKQPLRPRVIDLGQLLHQTIELLERTLGETIEIETVVAHRLWHCEVDPGQLESVIVNLAVNARDAMPDGGTLTIELRNAEIDDEEEGSHDAEAGRYVVLSVRDTGRGVPADVIEHVLDPFFTTKAIGEGSGLGLSMAYGFAKQSGGNLTIDSKERQGTTVKVYLPASDAAGNPSQRDDQVGEDSSGKHELILVVEDDDQVRKLAVKMLEHLGYRTIEASDGHKALKLLKERADVALLFTDVVLPRGKGGRGLAREAGELRPDLAVLFTSGYTEETVTQAGRLEPGVNLLEKPYSRADLAKLVSASLAATERSR